MILLKVIMKYLSTLDGEEKESKMDSKKKYMSLLKKDIEEYKVIIKQLKKTKYNYSPINKFLIDNKNYPVYGCYFPSVNETIEYVYINSFNVICERDVKEIIEIAHRRYKGHLLSNSFYEHKKKIEQEQKKKDIEEEIKYKQKLQNAQL